jgi:hypothetical protein
MKSRNEFRGGNVSDSNPGFEGSFERSELLLVRRHHFWIEKNDGFVAATEPFKSVNKRRETFSTVV